MSLTKYNFLIFKSYIDILKIPDNSLKDSVPSKSNSFIITSVSDVVSKLYPFDISFF